MKSKERGLARNQMVAIAAVVTIVIIIIAYYVVSPMFAPPAPKVLTVVMGADAVSLDAHDWVGTWNSATVINHIYDGLVIYDEKMNIKPCLATSWDISPDGRTYTFYLRKDVKFHDGTKFDASSVKFSLDRIRREKDPYKGKALQERWMFTMITEVTVIDDYTVQLFLEKPFAPLLAYLANPAGFIVSRSAVEKWGKDFAMHPVGTGPYMFVEWIPAERIVLKRNPDYWGGKPAFDQVVFKPVPEASARVAMLERGEAQVVQDIPAPSIDRLKADPNIKLRIETGMRVMGVEMNNLKAPFNDIRVRHALNYAVDKNAIVNKILKGLGTVADSPVAPLTFGHSSFKVYDYDPEKARQLLAEAGYPDGFKCKLWFAPGRWFMDTEIVEAIQSYLRDVGVQAEIETFEWATMTAQVRKPPEESKLDMWFQGWTIIVSEADMVLMRFESKNWGPGFNTGFYKNEEVDRLTVEAIHTVDDTQRANLYKEASRLIWEDAPWIWLYVNPIVVGVRTNVEGEQILAIEILSVRDAYSTE